MVTISILYPNRPGARFAFEYYTRVHMGRSVELLSAYPGYLGVSIERGIRLDASGPDIPFIAICQFQFTSAEAFMRAFTPHAAELQEDMKNVTDIVPLISFGEMLPIHAAQ